jgi:molybdate transport system ATP-binding protein
MSLDLDLTHRQGDFSLDVAFSAPVGITALFGRSGAGKTTLVNAVAGLLRPQKGRIAVNGTVLLDTAAGIDVPVHLRRVGYVFQEGRLFPHMTVRNNLAFGRRFAPAGAARESMDDVVDLLGIGHLLDRRPKALSGGEKQRVAIGRALLAAPRLLLLDEPLASLDEPRKNEILPYIERLRDELRIPVVYVSHSISEVARLATTIVVLRDGRVVTAGPARAMLADPEALRLLGHREAGAVLTAKVVRHHDDGLTELHHPAGALFLPRIDAAPGTSVKLRIRASDVMLATEEPRQISALNMLSVTVAEIHAGEGPGAAVSLAAGSERLLARLTRRSVERLGLEPGLPVFAIVKAVAIGRADVGASDPPAEDI